MPSRQFSGSLSACDLSWSATPLKGSNRGMGGCGCTDMLCCSAAWMCAMTSPTPSSTHSGSEIPLLLTFFLALQPLCPCSLLPPIPPSHAPLFACSLSPSFHLSPSPLLPSPSLSPFLPPFLPQCVSPLPLLPPYHKCTTNCAGTIAFRDVLWIQVALGDNLGGVMDYYMETATPSLTMVSYLLWIFLSNIVLVGYQ